MKLLDRYIIRKFLLSFLYTALLFTLISVVIDFADKSENLIKEEVPWTRILSEYYLNFIPYINGLLWPLFVLIAVIFFTSRLARDSEFIAMLNAGVSFRRLMLPYFITSVFIAILFFWGSHYIIPQANKIKFDFENTHIFKSNDKGKTRDVHMMVGPDTKVFVRYYRKSDTTARDVRIEKFKDGQISEVTEVERMDWKRPPNVWEISNYSIHRFGEEGEQLIIVQDSSEELALELYPKDFVRFVNDKEQMTSTQLRAYLSEQRAKGRSNLRAYEVELHRRTAESGTIIILTLIGMIVASRKVRGGLGLHLALGISLGAIFVFLSRFSVTFATNQSLNPILGVWLPNIIFMGVAIYLFTKAQR